GTFTTTLFPGVLPVGGSVRWETGKRSGSEHDPRREGARDGPCAHAGLARGGGRARRGPWSRAGRGRRLRPRSSPLPPVDDGRLRPARGRRVPRARAAGGGRADPGRAVVRPPPA